MGGGTALPIMVARMSSTSSSGVTLSAASRPRFFRPAGGLARVVAPGVECGLAVVMDLPPGAEPRYAGGQGVNTRACGIGGSDPPPPAQEGGQPPPTPCTPSLYRTLGGGS